MRTESLTIHPDLVEMEQEVSHMLAPTCANQPPLSFALCHLAAPKLRPVLFGWTQHRARRR